MKIRIATVEDIPGIMGLERASPSAAHWSERRYRELLEKEVGTAEKVVLVGEADGASADATETQGRNVAGFLVARSVAAEWELENIVVAVGARRGGLGRRLLQDLLARIHQAGGGCVFLEVRESNAAARGLDEKAGFRENGRRKAYYADPLEDAILYRQAIG